MTQSENGMQGAALAVVPKQSTSIEPQNWQELAALARHAGASHFYGAENESQALMILLAGRDLGLSYPQSLRAFHVVSGKPTLSADGMVAVCLGRREVCEYFRLSAADEKSATAVTKRVGDVERSYTFTIEDAQRAGLTTGKNGHTWKAHPRRMLSARAKAFLARDVFPDLLMGLYDPDEMAETRPEPSAPAARVELEPTIVYDPQAREAFLDAIAQTESVGSLKALAKSVANAKRDGLISAADAETIRASYELRMAEHKAAKAKLELASTDTPAGDSDPEVTP